MNLDYPEWAKPTEWSQHTLDVLTAVGTVGAVIVALLLAAGTGLARSVRERRCRPRLSLAHDPSMDVSLEKVRVRVAQKGLIPPVEEQYPALYLRLAVSNAVGRQAAEGVEVLLTELEPLRPSEVISVSDWDSTHRFNVGQLGWTHAAPAELRLGPGARRTVDLGYVVDHSDLGTSFHLGLTVIPESRVDQLPAGRYRVRLALVSANSNARFYELELYHRGTWMAGEPEDPPAIVTGPQPTTASSRAAPSAQALRRDL
jgi:hypothetical protein